MKVSELRKHLLKLKGSAQLTFIDNSGNKLSIKGYAISENDDLMFFNRYSPPRAKCPDISVEVIYAAESLIEDIKQIENIE